MLGDNKFISTAFFLAVGFGVAIWIGFPLLLHTFPYIGSKFVFFNMYRCPWYSDLTDFELFGLPPKYSRNFYLTNEKENLKLGFWHLLPESERKGDLTADEMENLLSKGDPVILYLHGNALNRGGRHIVDLYKALTSINLHVVAVDYRGYGDSEGVPWTEREVVDDAMTAWNYVKRVTRGKSPIFVYGHSLGTGISSSLLRQLGEKGERPTALFLESPFTSLKDGIRHHPLSRIYRPMPYFNEVFVKNGDKIGVQFNTIENLLYVDCPIMLLHSEDDHVIPYHFSETLYKLMKEHKKDVEYKLFPAGNRYFHVDLWRDPSFKDVVRKFVSSKVTSKPGSIE